MNNISIMYIGLSCHLLALYTFHNCTSPLLHFLQWDSSQELLSSARGGEVDINIQDKRTESYTKPKPKLEAFSGQGHKPPQLVLMKESIIKIFFFFFIQLCSWSCVSFFTVSRSNHWGWGWFISRYSSAHCSSRPHSANYNCWTPIGMRLVSKFNHTHTANSNDIRQFINLYPQSCLHFTASLGRGLDKVNA